MISSNARCNINKNGNDGHKREIDKKTKKMTFLMISDNIMQIQQCNLSLFCPVLSCLILSCLYGL